MIVTCPGCASKYRVRNEAVPAEGARMRCPKCETLFLAKPPAGGDTSDDLPSSTGPFSSPSFAPPPATQTGSVTSLPPQPAFGAPSSISSTFPAQQFSSPPQQAQPFGASPQFGAPGGFVPQQPSSGGPLTAMMRTFDPSSSSPSLPPTPAMPSSLSSSMSSSMSMSSSSSFPLLSATPSMSSPPAPADDDPFARINVDPRVDPGFNAPTIERMRPPTRAPTTTPMLTPPPPAPSTRITRAPAGPPSLLMVAASWVAVVLGGFGAVFGIVFAAWTSEAVDLDASLMPVAERTFGATPPYSFAGNDVLAVDDLRREATSKETAGDLPAAIVLWQRVQQQAPDDPQAKTALPRVLSALGERLR